MMQRAVRRRLIWLAAIAGLAAVIAALATWREAPASRPGSVVWRGMRIAVPECFVADPEENDLSLRSTGSCGGALLAEGTAWLTALHRDDVGGAVPFEQWNPCAEYDQCRTFRTRSGGTGLECYRAVTADEDAPLHRRGCRSMEHRMAIRYFCMESFCDELERVTMQAFASLPPPAGTRDNEEG